MYLNQLYKVYRKYHEARWIAAAASTVKDKNADKKNFKKLWKPQKKIENKMAFAIQLYNVHTKISYSYL